MEIQWKDDKLLIPPHQHFVVTNEDNGYVADCYGIRPIQGRLYVTVLQALQQQSATVAQLLQLLQQQFIVPYLLTAIEELQTAGIIENESSVNLMPVTEIIAAFPNDDAVVTLVNTRNMPAALDAWRNAMQVDKCWIPVFIGTGMTFVGPRFNKNSRACPVCLFESLNIQESAIPLIQFLPASLVNTIWQTIPQAATDSIYLIRKEEKAEVYTMQQRPDCSNCGNFRMMEETMLAPVQLYNTTSCYRDTPPAETWNCYSHLINPVTGIVRDFYSMGNDAEYIYGATIRGKSIADTLPAYGKGNSDIAAKVSCLCEAIERYSAGYCGNEALITASLSELSPLAIAPLAIQHFAEEQISDSAATAALGPVPVITEQNSKITWVPGWSLTNDERRYIPADAVFYGIPGNSRAAVFESNGLAAGNTLSEAVLQGLLELIERDATAIWWYNKLRRPPAPTFLLQDDRWFQRAIAQLHTGGWEVELLDLTIDTGVPVIAAVGCFNGAYLTGYGCHFSVEAAMIRALTELIQVRAIMGPVPPPAHIHYEYLQPLSEAKKFASLTNYGKSVEEICESMIQHLDTLNIETIVVNCSRPATGLPVVKVFTPGLRAFRPRFGAGRLYEVPVLLGLQAAPTPFEDMTPMWLTPANSLPRH